MLQRSPWIKAAFSAKITVNLKRPEKSGRLLAFDIKSNKKRSIKK
jgi:hypothetical protein